MNLFKRSLALMSVLMMTSCAATKPAVPAIENANDTPKLVVQSEPDAAPDAAPASFDQKDDQPKLPAGHPALPGQPSDGQPKLPAGHPPLPGDASGSGGGAADQGMPQLPSGHPDISKLSPTSQPTLGTLAIRAVQGTAGAPAVGADPILVQMYFGNKLVGKLEAKLDDDGTTTIENIPTGPGYQIVARVTHAGVEFDAVGEATSAKNELSVPVYETTEQKPDWNIQMRHMIAEPADDGMHVVDVIAVSNPADRAWLGEAPGADGKRTTFTLDLPAGASNVQLIAGFHDCCTKVEGGKIVNNMPLVPGVTQYRFAYVVPINSGKAELIASMPAPVKAMMVLMPEGTNAAADGLEGPKTVNMGGGNTTYFHASDLPANKTVKLSVTGITVNRAGAKRAGTLVGTAGPGANSFDSLAAVKAVGGVGALLILLLGGAFLFMKSPRNVRTESARS